MKTLFALISALTACAAFAQTPGMGDTRPTPPSLDEQRGPVGARPVAPEEPLERFRRPSLRLEDPAVLVRRTYVDTYGRSREVPR